MNKQELAILERAFASEINAAMQGSPLVIQTKSKVAAKLAEEGFLIRVTESFGSGWPKVQIEGYALTHAGRIAYCMTCEGAPE